MKLASCRWRFRQNFCECLEERRFDRVGGTQMVEVDVRIVVATNRNLKKLAEEKLVSCEGFVFPISAVPMTIPPLRERGERCADACGTLFGKIQRIQEARLWNSL